MYKNRMCSSSFPKQGTDWGEWGFSDGVLPLGLGRDPVSLLKPWSWMSE